MFLIFGVLWVWLDRCQVSGIVSCNFYFTFLFFLEVLVYTDGGRGASIHCVKLAVNGLQQAISSLLPGHANVTLTTPNEIRQGILRDNVSVLVMPGGRDLPYCEELNGIGNIEIKKFVCSGGSYLGLCAGAYYGCDSIQFSKGNDALEVCGERELKFYNGIGIGPVFPGFQYNSNIGAKSSYIVLSKEAEILMKKLEVKKLSDQMLGSVHVYYNGGPYFIPYTTQPEHISRKEGPSSIEKVLAWYTTDDGSTLHAAIVYDTYEKGRVVLSGVHVEACPSMLSCVYEGDPFINGIISELECTEQIRHHLFSGIIKFLLSK